MTYDWVLSPDECRDRLIETLFEFGVAVVRGALPEADRRQLASELSVHFDQSKFCEGLFYGQRTKRFGRALARSVAAQELALNPLAHETAGSILGPSCENIQLNLTQAIEIWPGEFAQVPHRDEDIWQGALHPGEMMLNAMWAIDDFTEKNGATLVWPGSHREPKGELPVNAGVPMEMPSGSLGLFLGSTLHCGGANRSNRPRRGLVMSYCLGWLKPCENPWLSYPPEVAAVFSPRLAHLVGYRQDAPSLNNVEGRCPSELLSKGRSGRAFADRLTEEHVELIRAYNAQQENLVQEAA